MYAPVLLESLTFANQSSFGIFMQTGAVLQDSTFDKVPQAIQYVPAASIGPNNAIQISNCSFNGSTLHALYMNNANNGYRTTTINITGCSFTKNGYAVYMFNNDQRSANSLFIDNCGKHIDSWQN